MDGATQENPLSAEVSVSEQASEEPAEKGGRAGFTAYEVGLLTGGFDRPYAFGLATALSAQGVRLEVIGSDEIDGPGIRNTPGLRFRNFQRGWRPTAGIGRKMIRLSALYWRLVKYAVVAKPAVFHILWNSRIAVLDRTVLMLLYRVCRRRVVLTAHNINTERRDGSDSMWNRFTLKVQYRLANRVFVHTAKMREELIRDFGVPSSCAVLIPFGINNAVRQTQLSGPEARAKLGVAADECVLLCFGRIQPYKGIEYVIDALRKLRAGGGRKCRLVVAGEPKKEYMQYWQAICNKIEVTGLRGDVIQRIEFIPDDDTEIYFKAADALVLAYTGIYQSGVLSLAYSFGLPVIASDVGSFREDIIEGRTGLLCRPKDSDDLARAIEDYFESDLFRSLDVSRVDIREYARARYSWSVVGEITKDTYGEVLGEVRS